jgi:hypothetical protein
MRFRGRKIRGAVVIGTLALFSLGLVLGVISLVVPTLLPYHDIVLLFSGVLIGFVSLTFDELFIRSPEREEAAAREQAATAREEAAARTQAAETTLVRLRNAFRLGQLLELKLRHLDVMEGNESPIPVDSKQIMELAKDLGVEEEVQAILSAPKTKTSTIGRLQQALLQHHSYSVAGSAYAGFQLGSMILLPGQVGIVTEVHMQEVVAFLEDALKGAFIPSELVDSINRQLLRLGSMVPGDAETFSIFAELVTVVFHHLDHDCAASIRVKAFLLTCDVEKPEFLSQARQVRDLSEEFHERSAERMKHLSDQRLKL